jgi:hypothetical protein
MDCLPAPGTEKITEHQHMCIEQGKLYTVCYDISHDGAPGSVHCGIFAGAAPALRLNGKTDCMGGCNEGHRSCRVHRHRSSCFVHDLCSLVRDATGFTRHPECGDEAQAALATAGRCHSIHAW